VSQGQIVEKVVRYLVSEIVDDASSVEIEVLDEGAGNVVAEVRTAKPDMGRVIGRRGRVARAIRTIAQVAGEEEGLDASVEFLD
jgi:predicted RNA-binding protein YlqC (UPF0109 family)